MKKRRVVITGMGVINASGLDLHTFWQSIRQGKSPASQVTRFDVSGLPTQIAAEIKNFIASDYMGFKKARRFDLSIQYGIAAAMEAVADANLKIEKMNADRVGVVEATTLSGMESAFRGQMDHTKNGYKRLSPYYLINAYCGGGSGEIALALGCRGHAITYSSGSASGNDAIGHATHLIRSDEVDVVIVGGAEAPLLAPIWGGFCAASLMTKRNGEPERSMRPFDTGHDGFLLGEGAAFLVVEELGMALNRGARIYAEILGHGRSCEAYHSVNLHPDGIGIHRAMEKALRDADTLPGEIQYINAHATATEDNDSVESRAIAVFFKEHSKKLAVSGTKPVTGHMLAAAGAVETVVSALAIHHSEIPPTANFESPQAECQLDYVGEGPRPYHLDKVMNLNSGFGGKNSCLILGNIDRSI